MKNQKKLSNLNAMASVPNTAAVDLLRFAGGKRFATILADPPWQFQNKTGKVAPEHKRLSRYSTLTLPEIMELPVSRHKTNRFRDLWVIESVGGGVH